MPRDITPFHAAMDGAILALQRLAGFELPAHGDDYPTTLDLQHLAGALRFLALRMRTWDVYGETEPWYAIEQALHAYLVALHASLVQDFVADRPR